MHALIKFLSLVLVGLFVVVEASAQKITFEATSPTIVAIGETFRVEYTLNADPENFTPPTFPDFDLLAGPTLAQAQSVEVSPGGRIKQSVSFIYTYVLRARKKGRFTIPSALVTVGGKGYSSNNLLVEVVEEGASPQNQTSASNGSGGTSTSSAGGAQQATTATSIAADDMLVRVSINRNNVFKGQPIKATFKLYSRVPVRGIEKATYPSFNGFWAQELNVDGYKWQRETYNGKVYDVRVIKETLLYPQQSGKLYIEQTSLTAVAQVIKQTRSSGSLAESLYGGGAQVEMVSKVLTASPIQVTVRELPSGAPESFTGAVGKFKLDGELSNAELAANSSTTYLLKISGNGNLPLIQAPKITLPASFEQYNMKTSESLNYSAEGIMGYRQFEYPFIPRAEGRYTIDSIQFSYFDPDLGKYVTLAPEPQTVTIKPDSTGGTSAARGLISGVNKEDLKILDQDIRFIRLGSSNLVSRGSHFFCTWGYWLILCGLLALAGALYTYLSKYLREQQNTTLVRHKKANKVALQRLKAAFNHMESGDEKQFYEEMLRALWGYMSDKLNIPVAHLTKESIREELRTRGISTEQIEQFIVVISDCEYAQYAPLASGQMNELYNTAAKILSKFESQIKTGLK